MKLAPQTEKPIKNDLPRAMRVALLLLCVCFSTLRSPAQAQSPATAQPRNAQACTDFDAYVNGAWNAQNEIPADQARIGSFEDLRRKNTETLTRALEKLATSAKAGEPLATPGLRNLARAYASAMDLEGIETNRFEPIRRELTQIDEVQRDGLHEILARFTRLRIALPINARVVPDASDNTRYRLQLGAGGLGLPQRNDYFGTDDESRRVQAAYKAFAQRMLSLLSPSVEEAEIAKQVEAVYAFEQQLAERFFTPVQMRDPNRLFNPQTLADLEARAPGLNWGMFLYGATKGARITPSQLPLTVDQPEVARVLGKLAEEAAMPVWRNYLRLRLLTEMGDKLHQDAAQAHFAYTQTALRGVQTPPARAERVIAALSGNFGQAPLAQALGELFVAERFAGDAQARADQMVEDIRQAMRARIQALGWMSDATKAQARIKLDAMVAQIGAPQPNLAYAQLNWGRGLDPRNYAGNVLAANAWAHEQDLQTLDKPVDRKRWFTAPHTVNAFAAGGNRIVFPAGILQPPFFDAAADDASNYGGIGMVIGHEITHHFDDRGRRFDEVGNLRDWWVGSDAQAYRERAAQLAAFYSRYEGSPGVFINGEQTLGENISDVAGIQIAFDGLQIALAREKAQGKTPALVNGHTPEQRFFLAHANVWRGKTRTQLLVQQLRTGQHSPGRFRILGPLAHTPAFAQAFGCQAGDPMVAKERVVIW